MTKGWYGNRYGHSLASKGIKSKIARGKTMTKIYLIEYNAIYDSGTNERSIEGYIENVEDFDKWLDEYNKERIDGGNEPEGREEFDIITTYKLI